MGADAISITEARRIAVAAQGLATARPPAAAPRHVRATVARLGVVQLDAINVVDRTQHIVLFSRVGAFRRDRFTALSQPGGPLFEYWGHMASVQSVEHHPLLRWRMAQANPYGDTPARQRWWEDWSAEHGAYLESVHAEVAERGPITAGQLLDPQRRDGTWWDRRGLGRQALEWLFAKGRVAAWRTPSFERVYDLPERVLPATVLATPTPSVEEAHRELLRVAASALGVATVADLADHHRLSTAQARPRVAELVEEGALRPVRVEGWRDPAFLAPDAWPPARRTRRHATLLSPFDSLVWFRARASRLFAFDYRIEVYVPAPRRRFGYYVLPLLVGDELRARFDVKADRAAGALFVRGSFAERDADHAALAAAALEELDELARWQGLERIEVADRGDLAPALQAAAAPARKR